MVVFPFIINSDLFLVCGGAGGDKIVASVNGGRSKLDSA
jgi:hypothetical protein